jgi:hypothetical protein
MASARCCWEFSASAAMTDDPEHHIAVTAIADDSMILERMAWRSLGMIVTFNSG